MRYPSIPGQDISQADELFINQAMRVAQRTCVQVLGDHAAADDATQAVFLVYWKKRQQLVEN